MALKFAHSSAGTIVNVAINIFRSDLRGYFSLAVFALLWSFLPIYGWAKSLTLLAAISTKAYQQLRGISESDKDICRRLDRKMWGFWGLNILGAFYIVLAFLLCSAIIIAITYVIINLTRSGELFSPFVDSTFFIFSLILLYLLVIVIVSSIFLWLYGRISFAELPMANEENRSVWGSMVRSWDLSRGQGRKIQLIFTIGTAILGILWLGVPSILLSIVTTLFSSFWLVFILAMSMFTGLFQIVKAVIYYDLICLREGVDLSLEY